MKEVEYQRFKPESREEKTADWLPDGTDKTDYVKPDKEWTRLERRIGQPRILDHVYFPKVQRWIETNFIPDNLKYFEAGCGHGNDLRAIKNALGGHGHFLGVDMSLAEIQRGLEYYREQDDPEAKQMFAQGDLRNLHEVQVWDEASGNFSKPFNIPDDEFDLVYFEAVMHGLGYGSATYHEKKDSAQQMLGELFRIVKPDGKLFGRASTFTDAIDMEARLKLLRDTDNWRFMPSASEFEEMLAQAGFKNIEKTLAPHPRADSDVNKKDVLKFSFLATS